jgi:hypothetical protein
VPSRCRISSGLGGEAAQQVGLIAELHYEELVAANGGLKE